MKLESHPPRTYTSSFQQNGMWCRFQHQYRYARAFACADKRRTQPSSSDSYHIIVSLLHYLLMTLNRRYSAQYHLPFDAPKNHHAFEFKQLLEKHILQYQQVADCFESDCIPQVNIPEGFYPHAINYMIKGICPKCSKQPAWGVVKAILAEVFFFKG